MTSVRNPTPDRPRRRRRWWWLPSLHTINWVLLIGGLLAVGVLRLQLAPYIWKQRVFIPAVVLLLALVVLAFVRAYRRGRRGTLAAMTLVCGLPITWTGVFVFQAVQRHQAERAIRLSGGSASDSGRITFGPWRFSAPPWVPEPIQKVVCDAHEVVGLGPWATDDTLKYLDLLPHTQFLILSDTNVTPKGMANLGKQPGLIGVRIISTEFSAGDLEHLAALSNLRWLMLDSCSGITDARLVRLRKALPAVSIRCIRSVNAAS